MRALPGLIGRGTPTCRGAPQDGHSIGGAAAILAASRRSDLAAVVSVSAFAHPEELMRSQTSIGRMPGPLAWWLLRTMERIIGHRFDDVAPRNRISEVSAPLMLVHGDRDDVVPVQDLYELSARTPDAQAFVVAGAGHADFHRFADQLSRIVDFFSEHVGGVVLQDR